MAEKTCKFGLLKSSAQPVADGPIQTVVSAMNVGNVSRSMYSCDIVSEFLTSYDAWIKSSKFNQIDGLDGYNRYMTFAITHAIEQFLMKHRNRRVRTFRGEYPGTSELISGYEMDRCYLEDAAVEFNDVVIMSAPFSGSGNQHPLMLETLDICEKKNVPVMIDCAFFGICKGLDIRLNGCVEAIAFSLSKCYGMHNHRIGMMYTNAPPVGIDILQKFGYTSRFGAVIALELFDLFGPDYIYSKYAPIQKMICNELGNMVPSDTVIFGNGDESWAMFNRGGNHNRVSFGAFISDISCV